MRLRRIIENTVIYICCVIVSLALAFSFYLLAHLTFPMVRGVL